MIRFEYHAPHSLDEAMDLLVHSGDGARLLAGGTALLVDMNEGITQAEHLISLSEVPDLNQVRQNGGWKIGAMVTLSTIEDRAEFLNGAMTALVEATRVLAGRQIRNLGTLGGNICHASPGADMVPPLLCLDAELHLVSPDGERFIELKEFLVGPDQTAIRAGEILTEVRIPRPPPRSGSTFLKVMRRQALDCSIVSVGAMVTLAKDHETCAAARIAIGAAAPVPFRAEEAESLLVGQPCDEAIVQAAAERAVSAAQPITDVRASAEYRRLLVKGLVGRAVSQAWRRAKAQSEEVPA